MAKCPRCGSDNFQYDLHAVGTTGFGSYYRIGTKSSWIIPVGQGVQQNRIQHHAIGVCKDCGFVDENKPEKRKGKKWPYILLIIAIFAAVFILVNAMTGSSGS